MHTGSTFKRKISVSFVLRQGDANREGYAPVRCIVRWHAQQLLFATGSR
jgi:hypothetical protein